MRAVSYTHLDVYKRQGSTLCTSSENLLLGRSFISFILSVTSFKTSTTIFRTIKFLYHINIFTSHLFNLFPHQHFHLPPARPSPFDPTYRHSLRKVKLVQIKAFENDFLSSSPYGYLCAGPLNAEICVLSIAI